MCNASLIFNKNLPPLPTKYTTLYIYLKRKYPATIPDGRLLHLELLDLNNDSLHCHRAIKKKLIISRDGLDGVLARDEGG